MNDWLRNNKDIVNIIMPALITGLCASWVTHSFAGFAVGFIPVMFILARLEDTIERMDTKLGNEIDKAIWICALDHVSPEERIEWTRRMRKQYKQSGDKITVGSQ